MKEFQSKIPRGTAEAMAVNVGTRMEYCRHECLPRGGQIRLARLKSEMARPIPTVNSETSVVASRTLAITFAFTMVRPNGLRLSCGATLERSQTQFYHRRRAPGSSLSFVDTGC